MNSTRLALLGLLLTAGAQTANALDFHADLYGGVFQGSSDTEPVDQRNEFGLMADLTLDVLPFGVCANVLYNKDDVDGATTGLNEVKTTEIQLGLFKQFAVPIVHPFIGGGATLVNSTIGQVGQADADESTLGAWAYVGARMTVLLIDFGVVVGYTYAEVEVASSDINVGGWRGGVFAGIGF